MKPKLTALLRNTASRGEVRKLRSSFQIPAVVYGHTVKNQNVTLNYHEFENVFHSIGTSSIIDLVIGGSAHTIPVLISEVQRNPISDRIIHVDLHAVTMHEKIKTEVAVHFIGESPAVKELGGNLVISKNKLLVECLPADLVSSIDVDLSQLTELDQGLHVRDLPIPSHITVLDGPDVGIVSVLAPRAEVEAPAPEAVPAEAAVAGEAPVEGAAVKQPEEGTTPPKT